MFIEISPFIRLPEIQRIASIREGQFFDRLSEVPPLDRTNLRFFRNILSPEAPDRYQMGGLPQTASPRLSLPEVMRISASAIRLRSIFSVWRPMTNILGTPQIH